MHNKYVITLVWKQKIARCGRTILAERMLLIYQIAIN